MKRFTFILMISVLALRASAQQPDRASSKPVDLTSISIEELSSIQVTSASKKAENLSNAPAAIYVVTGEDIRRGGFSSVPDALRTVPGLYVVQQSSHIWQVTARGFSGEFNNKMLVLIDGRLVYSPTFGGVYWDVQDPPLEDIDRIEVIRGPGGTLWGANAVNGVINVITKDSLHAQGVLVESSAGINEGYSSRVRYGGEIGDRFAYRIYGTSNYWLPTVNAAGAANYDTWTISQGGMRFDWDASAKDVVTFDGQGYSGRVRDVAPIFTPTSTVTTLEDVTGVVKGGHLLGRWKHSFGDRSNLDLLGYCDWTDRISPEETEYRNTCDIEAQHRYSFTPRQALTWGGSIFTTADAWVDTFTTSVIPPYRRNTTYSAFAQYDVALVPHKLRIIVGSKFEHNPYTGFEYQPQIRGVWNPARAHTVWAAISRAVRTPNLIDEGVFGRFQQVNPFAPPPEFLAYVGNPNLASEVLHAYEFGYRYNWRETFSLDATIYANEYDRLEGLVLGAPVVHFSPTYIDLPSQFLNESAGSQTHGLELTVRYTPIRRWTISLGATELRGSSPAPTVYKAAANNPLHEAGVQSRWDVTKVVNFDASYYYDDAVANLLPPLNRVDVGLSTKAIHGFSFSLWGRNLQQDRHREAIPQLHLGGEIPRSVVFKLTWESDERQKKTGP